MNQVWDEIYIKRCFELAVLGTGLASPNPLVGAVVVKNEKIIGEGFHRKYGSAHAEPDALSNCTEDVSGATLYCNLEPCCHLKKQTPPCTELIIKRGLKRVVISNLDPNPEVAGKGVKALREAGIEVDIGLLQEEGEKLNQVFFHWMKTGMPFIHLKWAQTLDGKIATISGDSKWISDEHARKEVHQMRLKYDGILVGRETLNQDNPRLDIRHVDAKGKTPWKIIVGDVEKMDKSSQVMKNADGKSLFVGKVQDDSESWKNLFQNLAKEKISSVLVEGGGKTLSALLKHELFDLVTVYIAPKILGAGRSYCDQEVEKIEQSLKLKIISTQKVGDQIRVDYIRG